jgi:hypothetical protein
MKKGGKLWARCVFFVEIIDNEKIKKSNGQMMMCISTCQEIYYKYL